MTVQIATAAEQQSSVAGDMGRNISDIELIAAESTRAAQGTVGAAVDIRHSMQHLKQLVAQFNIRAA
jgi:methyl-accepting chemotaxis protein